MVADRNRVGKNLRRVEMATVLGSMVDWLLTRATDEARTSSRLDSMVGLWKGDGEGALERE